MKMISRNKDALELYCIGNSQWCRPTYNTQSLSDQLVNIQSRVLQADWFILENDEKATGTLTCPFNGCNWLFHIPAVVKRSKKHTVSRDIGWVTLIRLISISMWINKAHGCKYVRNGSHLVYRIKRGQIH